MIQTLPYQQETVPPDVHSYLLSYGWYESRAMDGHVYYSNSAVGAGYYRWFEALTYAMWKRFHLGAV